MVSETCCAAAGEDSKARQNAQSTNSRKLLFISSSCARHRIPRVATELQILTPPIRMPNPKKEGFLHCPYSQRQSFPVGESYSRYAQTKISPRSSCDGCVVHWNQKLRQQPDFLRARRPRSRGARASCWACLIPFTNSRPSHVPGGEIFCVVAAI